MIKFHSLILNHNQRSRIDLVFTTRPLLVVLSVPVLFDSPLLNDLSVPDTVCAICSTLLLVGTGKGVHCFGGV